MTHGTQVWRAAIARVRRDIRRSADHQAHLSRTSAVITAQINHSAERDVWEALYKLADELREKGEGG